jgi:coenzyme F420-reducing hydrogenase gamma subunit
MKPKIAVYKFSSCDGCQLSLLDAEEELLAIAGAVDIAYFVEARRETRPGPYDIGLVEGSITCEEEIEKARQVRKDCAVVIAIGACATAGGIQALKNYGNVKDFVRTVYAHPEYIHTLEKAHPISEYVPVDFELRGCPISKHQLLDVISGFLAGRRPQLPVHPVCVECKRAGVVCVMVADGTPCLGPVTQAGCHALCPSFRRGCFGCYGPSQTANTDALAQQLGRMGWDDGQIARAFLTFNAGAPAFAKAGKSHA